jgi:lysophospholipase
MRLIETAGNPAPAGGLVLPVATDDGVTLRAAYWPPTISPPRGTVLLLHGRAEFIEKYFEVIHELLARGFAVATFDWRGQGSSARTLADGHKGHATHFADFRHDVEAVSRDIVERHLPKPLFCLAHSMGACIALIGAAEGWLPGERLVAVAPMVALSLVKHARLARGLARLLERLGLGARFVPGGRSQSISTEPFEGNRLSGDPQRYARNAAVAKAVGQGAVGSPTIAWLTAAYDAMEILQARGYSSRIKVPTLVIAAGSDPVCSTRDAEVFARGLGPGSRYLVVPGSRHEILMEVDEVRAAFWAAFDSFIPGSQDAPNTLASAAQEVNDGRVEPLVAAGQDGPSLGRRAAIP